MKKIFELFFLVLTYATGAGPAHAQEVTRPMTVYIQESPGAEVRQFDITFSLGLAGSSGGPMVIENDLGQTICSGVLGSRVNNWLFRDFKCEFDNEKFTELLLVQKSSWGVINHGVTLVRFKSGVTMGLLIHIGSEDSPKSYIKVDKGDFEKLYGTFPNWNLPEK